jgi:hypothetical protein
MEKGTGHEDFPTTPISKGIPKFLDNSIWQRQFRCWLTKCVIFLFEKHNIDANAQNYKGVLMLPIFQPQIRTVLFEPSRYIDINNENSYLLPHEKHISIFFLVKNIHMFIIIIFREYTLSTSYYYKFSICGRQTFLDLIINIEQITNISINKCY